MVSDYVKNQIYTLEIKILKALSLKESSMGF